MCWCLRGGDNAFHPDMTVTADGRLLALWGSGSQQSTIYYSQAPACCADDARSWSAPVSICPSAMGPGALDSDGQGRLYAACALYHSNIIVYSRSDDGGATWPVRVEVPGGSVTSEDYPIYPRLAVDGRGRVHLVWTVQAFPGRLVMYARSDDGGETWSEPVEIDNAAEPDYQPDFGPVFIDVETHGDDEVHLIWDGAPTVERNHIWSADGGDSWSAPTILFPEITSVGRAGWNDMVFDSAGVLHAVALGKPWNAVWSNGSWSPSQAIVEMGHSEWMRVDVGLGNQLHAVWLSFGKEGNGLVFYARGVAAAPTTLPQALPEPALTPVPRPTPEVAQVISETNRIPPTTAIGAGQSMPGGNPREGALAQVSCLLSALLRHCLW